MTSSELLSMTLIISIMGCTGCASAQEDKRSVASYETNCLICHGEDGSGDMPGTPNLLENSGWAVQPDAQLVKRIQQGIQSENSSVAMPPNAGNPALSEQDLLLAINHLRQLLKSYR